MTVETETASVVYTGSGSAGPFSVPFYFINDEDLTVIRTTIADGTESTFVLSTDYTVSGAGDEAGGSITLTSTLSSSYKLTILRDPQVLQETDYPPNDEFPAESHERALDLLTMIAQRHAGQIEKSVRFSDGYVGSADPTLPAPGAGEFLRWNNGGTALETIAASPDDDTFTQSGTGAVARSWSSKVGEIVSAFDFMTAAQVSNAKSMATVPQEMTAALQAAFDSLYDASTGFYSGALYLPKGRYGVATSSQLKIRPDTRGFKMWGDGARASVLVNLSATARDALWVGDDAPANTNYDVHLSDFKVEGTDSDGIGVKWHNTLHSSMSRVFTEFTGSHGFDFDTCWDCRFHDLHARRAGYNGGAGRLNVAGFRLTNNCSALHFPMAEECNIGILGNTTGLNLIEPDCEASITAGLKLIGVSNANITRGYGEGSAADAWIFGDGANEIQYVFLTDGSLGNSVSITFNKVAYYEIDRYDFGAFDGTSHVFITDPAYTRGRIGSIYPRLANTASADKATIFQHIPSNPIKWTADNNLLGANGSFETDITTNWTKAWLGAAGTVANSQVAGLGLDIGAFALRSNVTVATSTYTIYPAWPTLVSGRYYTLEFDYTATTNNKVAVTLATNGVRHFNFLLAAAATPMHVRIIFKAQGTVSTNQLFNILDVCDFYVDGVALYEGVRGVN